MTTAAYLELERRSRRSPGRMAHATGNGWSAPLSAADRTLVVLIENGGIDLGIPELVDSLLDAIPGGSRLPDSFRADLIEAVRDNLRRITDNLLESAELALGRYQEAKPAFFGDVVVLRDGTASYAELKAKLIALSSANKVIDLMVLTHGNADFISVAGGIDGAKIRAIKTEHGRPLSLRSVYMMNCVGSTLNQAWIDAGARTSCGSVRNNYLPEPTTYFFWQAWKEGQTFENAATGAYRRTVALMNTLVGGVVSQVPVVGGILAGEIDFATYDFVRDSAPVVQGERTITINSDQLATAQSRTSSLATTVLPVGLLRQLSDAPTPTAPRSLSAAGLQFIRSQDPGAADLELRVSKVERALADAVTVPLNQNQFDALVSFAINVGGPGFRDSTLLRRLNEGDYAAVPVELRKWVKGRQNGSVVDVPELVRRRAAEAELFERPAATADGAAAAAQSVFGRAFGAVDFTIQGLIHPLRQNAPMTCWATVITMMTNWRHQTSQAPRDVLAAAGPDWVARYDRGEGLDSNLARGLYTALGLEFIESSNPSIEGWEGLLRQYGPLYVDIGFPGTSNTHAVIVTAIQGDGTATGTFIKYIDPAAGTMMRRRFDEFLKAYEAEGAVRWPYVIVHWPQGVGPSQLSLPISDSYSYVAPPPAFSQQQTPLIAGIAVADAIQIGLAGVAIAQTAVSASQGSFTLTYDKAARLLTNEARAAMPGSQATKQTYSRRVLYLHTPRANHAAAEVIIDWEGNPFGEIGTPIIRRALENSTEWSRSSANITITKVDKIPPADTDPRTWPITYHYEGTYDPIGNGYFEVDGEFEINAFGAIKFNKHQVVSRSFSDWIMAGNPLDRLQKGPDVAVPVPEVPAEQIAYLRSRLPN